MAANVGTVAELVGSNEQSILPEWIALQKKSGTLQTGRITESELLSQSHMRFERILCGRRARISYIGRQLKVRDGSGCPNPHVRFARTGSTKDKVQILSEHDDRVHV